MLQSSSGSQRRQDFTQLSTALQSGNLQGAQQAFSNLEQLQGGPSSSSSGGSTSPATSGSGTAGSGTAGTNAVANDFAALGQALSSGDLSQAQSAFTQLQTDMQSAKQSGSSGGQTQVEGHRHHHHGGGGESAQPSSSSTSSGSTSPGSVTAGSVNLVG
jgi:hypothetical protein